MLPGLEGVETYQQLRRIPGLVDTPIIFMTAKAQPQEIEQYTALGCAGVITKPFDPMTLSDEIQGLWDRQL
jgi:CheY-like chemotaxis protein